MKEVADVFQGGIHLVVHGGELSLRTINIRNPISHVASAFVDGVNCVIHGFVHAGKLIRKHVAGVGKRTKGTAVALEIVVDVAQ